MVPPFEVNGGVKTATLNGEQVRRSIALWKSKPNDEEVDEQADGDVTAGLQVCRAKGTPALTEPRRAAAIVPRYEAAQTP
jgi:hypothetical protein